MMRLALIGERLQVPIVEQLGADSIGEDLVRE
jgi:hypothetical protein